MAQGTVTFISGGARSGKSAYAERLLVAQATGRLVYIASGVAFDHEMEERIAKHQHDRKDHAWLTIEQPVDLHQVVPLLQQGDFVLWDCLTTWLTNEMYKGIEDGAPCWKRPDCLDQKRCELLHTIEQIREIAAHLVIVSNEVLDEWPHYDEETEFYRNTIGTTHQQIVQCANAVIEMDHGLPVVWKGDVR
ncbi:MULTISPECIES: bifunctional adenosylcobinamide kinase/adenosylcobinamide-phosphate guanylyltransferase [unclassified Sporosarcina]|uniref:bifunctional adenosylcobinamide kinase/adenosylcobinamide-phosphate guanylyltransferase n=1 Tax=unclassified Sporosarcina TaxID=2647733 RepID=UPI0030FA21D5